MQENEKKRKNNNDSSTRKHQPWSKKEQEDLLNLNKKYNGNLGLIAVDLQRSEASVRSKLTRIYSKENEEKKEQILSKSIKK